MDYELLVPLKAWFSLKEACELKGICYKTVCNKTYLQPNRGKADGSLGGAKKFKRSTIVEWLGLSDEDIARSRDEGGQLDKREGFRLHLSA